MAMGDGGGSMNPIKQGLDRPPGEPLRDRQNSHQRSISVAILSITSSHLGTHPICDPSQSLRCGHSNIENSFRRSPKTLVIPSHESLSHIVSVKFVPRQAVCSAKKQ